MLESSNNTVSHAELQNNEGGSGGNPKKTLQWVVRSFFGIAVCGVLFLVFQLRVELFQTMIIDNPTKDIITVSIDDKEYKINPDTWQKVPVSFGHHTVWLAWKEIGTFERGYFDFQALLNPTKYTYIFVDRTYTSDLTPTHTEDTGTIEVWGQKYEGLLNPKKKNSLYFRSNEWDYGIDKKFPSSLQSHMWYEKKTKIFHASEFSAEFQGNLVATGAKK